MLSLNTSECLIHSSADFEDTDESTLLSMVKMEILDITEAELFDAVKYWAGKQCLKEDKEITGFNMRQVQLNSVLFFFHRFLIASFCTFDTGLE